MGVPAHDDRDYAFANKNNLPIIKVIENDFLVESGPLNGLKFCEAT